MIFSQVFGQQSVSISDVNGATPNASSVLDISSTSKGLLIPRVSLTSTTVTSPVTSPLTSLLVYNTQTINDVTPGYYYWNGTSWQRFDTGNTIGDWKLLGNAGTNAGTNFLGTTDATDLVFRTNSTEKMRVMSGGNVGIGESNPQRILHLKGSTSNVALRLENSSAKIYDIQSTSGGHLHIINQTSSPTFVAMQVNGTTNNIGLFNGTPDVSASVDITALDPITSSNTRGLLIPRLALTATNVASPVNSPATSLLVYNSVTAGTSPYNVSPGYYYNAGNTATPNWKRFATGNGDAWIVGGNNFGTTGANYNLGTISNDHVDFVTNNIVRGRLSNLGEFFIGTTATALVGDLMNGVSNATFPWAINGYSANNGAGTFGSITAGTTNFAGVQGEYSGTSVVGAGVRGIAMNPNSIGVFGVENIGNGWAGYFNGDVNCAMPFGYYNLSDQRLKTNSRIIKSAISKLQQINGYEYDLNIAEFSKYISKDAHRLGVMAQEVEKVFPDLVVEKFVPANNTKYSREENNNESHDGQKFKAVNYDGLIPVLIEAIKEQQVIIKNLEKRIEILEKTN
ncbi:MAG: tail fiber domain-containing protein [Flavobacteriales bacterium]|nr:tail fiber domain-containing protein [Crocinitomicaceae bacterium]NBX80322.1 tail fiber domain-containing protein [Flavobacteriales bacterium]